MAIVRIDFADEDFYTGGWDNEDISNPNDTLVEPIGASVKVRSADANGEAYLAGLGVHGMKNDIAESGPFGGDCVIMADVTVPANFTGNCWVGCEEAYSNWEVNDSPGDAVTGLIYRQFYTIDGGWISEMGITDYPNGTVKKYLKSFGTLAYNPFLKFDFFGSSSAQVPPHDGTGWGDGDPAPGRTAVLTSMWRDTIGGGQDSDTLVSGQKITVLFGFTPPDPSTGVTGNTAAWIEGHNFYIEFETDAPPARRRVDSRSTFSTRSAPTNPAPHGNPPLNSVEPVISGDQVVDETLSVDTGTWSNSPIDYNYQWLMDGVAVTNANAPTYTLVDADFDKVPTVEVTAANAYGTGTKATGRKPGNGKVKGRVTITGAPVLTGTESQAYAGFSITGAGGASPYTYSVSSGTLPTGLSLNASTGAVSGTPSVPGAFAGIILRATDAQGRYANLASFTITIAAAPTGVTPTNSAYVPVLAL